MSRSVAFTLILAGCSSSSHGDPDDLVPDASGSGTDAPPPAFTESPSYEPVGPLCDIPPSYVADGGDPHDPPCEIAIGAYRAAEPSFDGTLRVVAWNVRYGKDAAAVTAALATRPELASADVLLLSEVPRRSLTSSPSDIDLAHDLAVAAHMSYAFAVEWDRRENPSELGEHGVAVLSRFPIGAARMVRHTALHDWWADKQLYGGRVSLGVDLLVGDDVISAYVVHYDTRGGDAGRAIQAAETLDDTALPDRPAIQIVGGDLNTWTCNPAIADCTVAPAAEAAVEDFVAAGWQDGCAGWNGITQLGEGFFPQRLDWIFYQGSVATSGRADDGATGSDHLPVYFDMHLAR